MRIWCHKVTVSWPPGGQRGYKTLRGEGDSHSNFPLPNTQKQLREFLGLVNFYHRFVQNCAKILQPLNKLLSTTKDDKVQLQWDDDATAAFSAIKEALASATLLFHPKQDAPTSIMTDASSFAVGAVHRSPLVPCCVFFEEVEAG